MNWEVILCQERRKEAHYSELEKPFLRWHSVKSNALGSINVLPHKVNSFGSVGTLTNEGKKNLPLQPSLASLFEC